MTAPLRWKQDGYLHFAHAKEGMYVIEQHRGRFILTLTLAGTLNRAGTEQDMGFYRSLAKAKVGAQRDHRVLERLD